MDNRSASQVQCQAPEIGSDMRRRSEDIDENWTSFAEQTRGCQVPSQMVGKFVRSCDEVSDAECYEPTKKGSKDNLIIFGSMCAGVETDYLSRKENLFRFGSLVRRIIRRKEMRCLSMKKRRKKMKELEREDFDPFLCSSFDTKLQSTKKKLKGDSEHMDFEMSYARVYERIIRIPI
ncbi:hypothetical protein FNV43_RR17058 [Rhamnella rubrinervis]|uniref:Uncharacterized protein n=1 Tax=Rhamnella rubrinervis TaxID=2594499 RepID=A0A8K0ME88_9ROSA|nr:hypothetical protein FNV43_RR17058 [Rhamnella rubrinervis]